MIINIEMRIIASHLPLFLIFFLVISTDANASSTNIYDMDELKWNGTSGEVIDSTGALNGTAASLSTTKPSTASTTPAISGTTGTCSYGVFNRSNKDYVALPSSFPNLGSTGTAFTITAWIKTTDNTQGGQRIFEDDEHDTSGYGLSLGDGAKGVLRFFSRGTPSALVLDTTSVINNNTWYFVAAVADVPNKKKYIYVFNAVGTLLSSVSAAWTESSFGSDVGISSIGGETNSANEKISSFGFSGNIDEVQVFNTALSQASIQTLVSQTHDCSSSGAGIAPAFFNCIEVGAAASSNLYTKLVSNAFNLDVVAVNASGTVDTGYVGTTNKTVTMELVDGSGATACASRTAISPAVSQSLTFTSSNQGRKTTSAITVNNANANLRCRMTDANQTPSIVACSTDNFSVRPTNFTVTSSTATADNTGTSGTTTPAIKTGASFNLAATAVAGYNGAPSIDTSKLLAHNGAIHTGSLTGSFTAANILTGVSTNSSFAYSEVGYFALAVNGVYDSTFAAVDSVNSDCTADFSNVAVGGKYGCNFGNNFQTNYFGRFIPHHFVTSILSNGAFDHSCSTFTYNGQPLNYGTATHPMLNVFPYNSTSSVTQNYSGTFNRLLASQFTLTTPTTDAQNKGLDNINLVKLSAALDTPTLADYGSGNLTLKLGSDVFTYQRENNALVAPFSNAIAVTVSGVTDSDGVTATTLPMILQPSGENIYYGRVNLINAYGSELLDLSMPLTAEYWNGSSWVKNSADQCTTGITLTAAQVTGPLVNLCVWDTGVGNGSSSLGCSVAGTSVNKFSQPPLATKGGDFNLNFKAPGINNTGEMEITATVPAYLNFNWKGTGNINPIARATFGIYKGNIHIIYMREVY